VFISIATVFFLLITINTFCAIDMGEVASFFTDVDVPSGQGNMSVFDAGQEYLKEAALYSHNAMTAVRFHQEAYTVMSFLNAFVCDFNVGSIGLGCWYGYSGTNQLPVGGYGTYMAALNIFFNGTIIAHFSALNFLFILLFVYKGFVFLFLPLGVFLRSMPYLRSFGSLLISVALAFILVYPFMLSIFYLMGDVLVDRPAGEQCLACSAPCPDCYIPDVEGRSMKAFFDESVFPDNEGAAGAGQALLSVVIGGLSLGVNDADVYIGQVYFGGGSSNPMGAMMFGAYAFVAAVFMPTAALLATIASVSYIARLYGEEIDLSRITQLV
jgi:hypothetical protein